MSPVTASDVGLRVRYGTRIEGLVDELVVSLRDTWPADPFAPVRIMVQSAGMSRWLSHQLAQHLAPAGGGITANLRLAFPQKVVAELAAACLPDHPADDPWEPDRLVWSVLAVLTEHRGDPHLARLERYLAPTDTAGEPAAVDRRTWRFARRIADVLQTYSIARPRMVAAWSDGRGLGPDLGPLDARESWQPWLWRRLIDHTHVDPAARAERLVTTLRDGGGNVPFDRLWTFGISVLPPAQLELLSALAQRVPVELFVPTASVQRWETVGAAVRDGYPRPLAGHPLLASCGRVVDDAAHLFATAAEPFGSDGMTAVEAAAPDPPDPLSGTLLGHLQAGIRRDALPATDARPPVEPEDRSVRIHRCYGPSRQAEVLRDALLRLLAEDPTLQPRDVLVMTPDIATFAPLVQAAFVGSDGVLQLPVRVADRRLGATNPVADIVTGVLDLAAGRATSAQVLDLLGRAPVARRFGVSADAREQVAQWVVDTGVRWGIDDHHRAEHGQPPDRAHTWRFGLDRLLLGVAMADEDHRVLDDVTPYDHIEGDDVVAVGRVTEACTALFAAAAELRAPRAVGAWVDALLAVLERCVDTAPDDRWQVDQVRERLGDLRDVTPDVGPAIDLAAIRVAVDSRLDDRAGTAGYETGAVTLCELVPMRSIPHRVVALLGIDDGSFPRSDRRAGFDLLDRHDDVGDRDRRREDRALFLEAVLAARQHLLVTTTGWDVQTGQERPPAVPLAELLETIDATAHATGGAAAAVTIEHPLQAFSPAAFDPARRDGPHAFDPVLQAAAALTGRDDRLTAPLLDVLPEIQPDSVTIEVPLRELIAAVTHPTRYLLRDRLRVDLREEVVEVDELEPVRLDPLRQARLGDQVLVDGASDGWVAAQLASGVVPAGTPGRVTLRELGTEVDAVRTRLTDTARALGLPADRDPLRDAERHHLEVVVGGRVLVGDIDGLHHLGPDAGRTLRLTARYARRNPTHLLEAWITHVALTAAGFADLVTVVVTRGGSGSARPHRWHLGPLTQDAVAATELALRYLTGLLDLRDEAHRRRVPLFARAAERFLTPGRGKSPMASARDAFAPDFGRGDVDEYVQEVYGPDVTLDDVLADPADRDRFQTLARTIWGPAIAAHDGFDLDAMAVS